MAETVKTELMKQMNAKFSVPPYFLARELLLSVSGGLDSMVLLDVCHRMRHVHRSPIRVLHVHHNTGTHAEEGLSVVTRFCQAREIILEVIHFEWDGEGNFEHEAAHFRRQALEKASLDQGSILLAHHLQDQAETVLQQWVRGTGIATPLGMNPRHQNRLRPFLDKNRELIAEHARLAGVPHVLDPTNHDSHHFRTALRRTVMPELREFHQDFESRLGDWVDDFQIIQRSLESEARALANRWLKGHLLRREAFYEAPRHVWDFLLRLYWERMKVENPARQAHKNLIHWLSSETRGSFDHGAFRVYCDLDGIAMVPRPRHRAVQCRIGEDVDWRGWRFRLEPGPADERSFPPGSAYRISPPVRFSKAFKDFLRRGRTPYRYRDALPLITLDRDYQIYELIALEQKGMVNLVHLEGPPLKALAKSFSAPG